VPTGLVPSAVPLPVPAPVSTARCQLQEPPLGAHGRWRGVLLLAAAVVVGVVMSVLGVREPLLLGVRVALHGRYRVAGQIR